MLTQIIHKGEKMLTTEQRRLNGAKGYKQKQLNKQKQIQERKTENERYKRITQNLLQNNVNRPITRTNNHNS